MTKTKYILFAVVVVMICSCSKSLDTKPFSFTTTENFYKTSSDAEIALNGCYSVLNAEVVQGVGGTGATFSAGMEVMLSAGTDELVTRNGLVNDYAPFGLLDVTSQNNIIRYNWFFLFAGINRANYLLDGMSRIEMEGPRKAEIIGEAHFLRGLFYMYLAMMYGGVPVYTTPVQDPAAPRQSLQEVYELVISDFKTAYASLPDRAGIVGRANKWSAAGYLAKVYTYLASCKQNNVGADLNFPLNSFDWVDAPDMYQQALTLTTEIITSSGYKLIDKYPYLFHEGTNNWKSQESLFSSISSTNPLAGNYHIWIYFQVPVGNTNLVGGGYAWFRPTGELYYKYNAADTRRGNNLSFQLAPTSAKEVIEGVTYYVPNPVVTPKSNNYTAAKYRMMDPATKTVSLSRSTGDVPLLRYADILLLRAEALYFTGHEPEAREDLEAVRKRSAANDNDLNTLTTVYYKADFAQELLDERARELCFENWRRIDIIRFGKYGEFINALDPTISNWNSIAPTLQANWKPHKIWFPLPQTELELAPSLEQNPDY